MHHDSMHIVSVRVLAVAALHGTALADVQPVL
jgi:hypothetical protein